jgi:hypothetical protein
MNEGAQERSCRIAVDHGARFAKAHTAAADAADCELLTDQRVQIDASRDQVPPVLAGGQRWVERFAHLGLDQRQCTAGDA